MLYLGVQRDVFRCGRNWRDMSCVIVAYSFIVVICIFAGVVTLMIESLSNAGWLLL